MRNVAINRNYGDRVWNAMGEVKQGLVIGVISTEIEVSNKTNKYTQYLVRWADGSYTLKHAGNITARCEVPRMIPSDPSVEPSTMTENKEEDQRMLLYYQKKMQSYFSSL